MKAAAHASDRTQPEPARRGAAGLCTTLSREVRPDKALCAALLQAATASVDTPLVVFGLVDAARVVAPEEEKLVSPLIKLCAAAHTAWSPVSVVAALLTLVRLEGFDGSVPAEWLSGAHEADPEIRQFLKGFAVSWVRRFRGKNDSVLSLVRELQDDWFLTPRKRQWLRLADLIALHVAQPTPAGWIALA